MNLCREKYYPPRAISTISTAVIKMLPMTTWHIYQFRSEFLFINLFDSIALSMVQFVLREQINEVRG